MDPFYDDDRYTQLMLRSDTYGLFYQRPYMICPYDPSHCVSSQRFPTHVMNCRKSHPHIKKRICPYDVTHHYDAAEMVSHIAKCPNRQLLSNFGSNCLGGNSSVREPNLVPVQNRENDEDWDDTFTPLSQSPSRSTQLLVDLTCVTPSERARFREERNEILKQEMEPAGSEESGIDPCFTPDPVTTKTVSSIMTQVSLANKNISGMESLAADAETFNYHNKTIVDGSTTDLKISSDIEQNTPASVRTVHSAAMSICSESASQASNTPKMLGRGDYRRANRHLKPGYGYPIPQFESTENKIMKGRTANILAPGNHHQPYEFNDLKAALPISGISESTYDPSHSNEYHHEGVAQPSDSTVRHSFVQSPPTPWADKKLSTDFWEPEASSVSSPPRRVYNTSGQADYSLCGIGRGTRCDN